MKALKLTIVLFWVGVHLASGQELVQKSADCSGFHEKMCPDPPQGFKRNGQSKSALFAVGDTSEINFVAYKGHDYRIDICKGEIFSNKVQFKILDTETKKVQKVEEKEASYTDSTYKDTTHVYKKKDVLLYDNAKHDDVQKLEFSNPDKTKRLTIKVITRGESSKSSKLKTRDMGCVGLSISHAPTRDTGF